jgi:hypothetical protein
LLDEARQVEAERFLSVLAAADRADLDRILGVLMDDLA